MSAMHDPSHKNGSAQDAGEIQARGGERIARTGEGDQVENGAYYVQWIKHADVESRCAEGWHVAGGLCHHNMYAVLMRAPEGWEP